jgi:hypothetical protein
VTWLVRNNKDNQTSRFDQGSFALAERIQLVQEAEAAYAAVFCDYSLDASGATEPVNNQGKSTSGKITDVAGTLEAKIYAKAYRKPFYGALKVNRALDIDNLTSDVIRSLPKSGNATDDLPKSLKVPAGTQMVIFAARAGTKETLTAVDTKSMNAEVHFTKIENAIEVEGANGFEATAYDIWYVDWNPYKLPNYTGIASEKQLELIWA